MALAPVKKKLLDRFKLEWYALTYKQVLLAGLLAIILGCCCLGILDKDSDY